MEGVQVPRIRSVPPYESSRGGEAVELAERCGLKLDRWQRDVLVDSLGCRADGKFAAFEVGLNVPRQNGKGGILEARELASILIFGDQLVIHSSHEFATSMVAMDRMQELIEEGGLVGELRARGGIKHGHGDEGFKFKTGQRIWYRTRTKGGGRGFSADLVILDEVMVLQEAFHGALLPIVSARTMQGNPQVWYTGSAVDQMVHEHGVVFARVRERGIAGDPSLAYFEHSAGIFDREGREVPLDRVDAALLARVQYWAEANPALQIRIAAEHVEIERRSMGMRTFAVERLGIGDWPPTSAAAAAKLNLKTWASLADPGSAVLDPVRFAFDVTPDRAFASIGVAGRRVDGLMHVEVAERRKGTGWVVDRVVELLRRHPGSRVVCDAAGPASSLLRRLDELGVEVETVTAREMSSACGLLYDLVEDRGLRHLGQDELDDAVEGAATRPLGDAWAWSRKSSLTDISPLVAVTLAAWFAAVNAGPSVYEERGLLVV